MNTDNLLNASQRKAKECHARTTAAIAEIIAAGKPLTFSSVMRTAGVSRTYLYQHDEFRKQIMGNQYQPRQAQDSQAALIRIQKAEIARLKRELAKARKRLEKIDALESENQSLKRQLRTAYTYD
jgi:hypothetical protein